MPREITRILLPLFAGAAAILSGILGLQIAGAVVIMVTLAWPVLGIRERPTVVDQVASTSEESRQVAVDEDVRSIPVADLETSADAQPEAIQIDALRDLIAKRDKVVRRLEAIAAEEQPERAKEIAFELAFLQGEIESLMMQAQERPVESGLIVRGRRRIGSAMVRKGEQWQREERERRERREERETEGLPGSVAPESKR